MLPSPGLLFTIISFLLVIGPLVFVHELGHYLVARWCGIGAETFPSSESLTFAVARKNWPRPLTKTVGLSDPRSLSP